MTARQATAQQRVLIGVCLDAGVSFFWLSSGLLLIKKSDLADILPAIIEAGETILGFEGFELDGSDVHSRLDLIVDVGPGPFSLSPILTIKNWPENVWVDVAMQDSSASGDPHRALT